MPGSTGVQTGAQGVGAQSVPRRTWPTYRRAAAGAEPASTSRYLYPSRDAAVGDTVEGQSHAWVEWWCGSGSATTPPTPYQPGTGTWWRRGRDYADVACAQGRLPRRAGRHLGVTVEITRLA
ncbi:hypothetical protein ACFQX7_38775 [Luedemannella flava]